MNHKDLLSLEGKVEAVGASVKPHRILFTGILNREDEEFSFSPDRSNPADTFFGRLQDARVISGVSQYLPNEVEEGDPIDNPYSSLFRITPCIWDEATFSLRPELFGTELVFETNKVTGSDDLDLIFHGTVYAIAPDGIFDNETPGKNSLQKWEKSIVELWDTFSKPEVK